jgi:hypothetical protein
MRNSKVDSSEPAWKINSIAREQGFTFSFPFSTRGFYPQAHITAASLSEIEAAFQIVRK